MNLIDLLASAQGGAAFDSIGRQFGLTPAQTRAAVEQLAPVVAAGVRRNAREPQGMVELLEALQRGEHGRYVEDPEAIRFDAVRGDGNAILGHVLGSKQVSREVAMQAANTTGIGAALLKKLLPVIAAMVVGAIAKNLGAGAGQRRQAPQPQPRGGGLGDILGDILGGGQGQGQPQPRQQPQPGGVSLDEMLRDILGGGQPQRRSGGRTPGPAQPPQYDEEAVRRGRTTLDDMLGGGTQSGNAADDLLSSVERHLRRR